MAPYSDPYTTGTDIGPGQIMMLYLFPRTSETYILVLAAILHPLEQGSQIFTWMIMQFGVLHMLNFYIIDHVTFWPPSPRELNVRFF